MSKTEGRGKNKVGSKRLRVIIGTSGSADYLKDTTGNRRYWSGLVPGDRSPVPPSPEDLAFVQRLVEKK